VNLGRMLCFVQDVWWDWHRKQPKHQCHDKWRLRSSSSAPEPELDFQ
jgi:hypothetical protein